MRKDFAEEMAFKRCLRGVQVPPPKSLGKSRGERHIPDRGKGTYKAMKARDAVFGPPRKGKDSIGCGYGRRGAAGREGREEKE